MRSSATGTSARSSGTTLFKERRPGYLDLAVEKSAIKSDHLRAPRVRRLHRRHERPFRRVAEEERRDAQGACRPAAIPKEVIADLAEDLLAHYAGKPLIDPYDVYQHLMDYWAETMQDDCYLIAADGWKAETYRIIEKDKKGKEKDKGWACDLVPKALIVARYFAKEQAAIDQLAAELESVTARLPSWRKNTAARTARSPTSTR